MKLIGSKISRKDKNRSFMKESGSFPGVGSLTGWKRKSFCRSMAPGSGTLSPEVL